MTMTTIPVYLIWALIVFPIVLVVAYILGSRRGKKGQRAEDNPSTAPDPNPLLASPDMFDPHGIVAAAEQYGDQYEIRQHSESHSFARWTGMHADRLGHIRKGQRDAGDHHEDAAPTRRGGRNAGFIDCPSPRLTPGQKNMHDEDREHWDMQRPPPLTKGMVRETVDSLSRGDRPGGLSKDLEEMYSVLDELDEGDGRAD